MKRFLLPVVLGLVGAGGGAAAGLLLQPAPAPEPEPALGPCGEVPPAAGEAPEAAEAHAEAPADAAYGDDEGDDPAPADADGEAPADDAAPADDYAEPAAAAPGSGHEGAGGSDYVELDNQFVVPILDGGDVTSLVMLSLSLEVPAGGEDAVLTVEPKLRDAFLQVLFDHANTGGFDGLFTATSAMRALRGALLAAARDEVGPVVTDVLVTDMVRQEQ